MINDLLKLSRLTRADMNRVDVNLGATVKEILRELGKLESERQVVSIMQPDLFVKDASNLLRVILENLVGNAWKFTNRALPARFDVGVEKQEDERVYYVKDNGVGFDMKYVNKFSGAIQGLNWADDFDGTVIGLATVQRIVRRHGGRVQAEGQVCSGARFYFTLS